MRSLPFVKGRIEKEIEGTVTSLQKSFNKGLDNFSYYQTLPQKGLSEVYYTVGFTKDNTHTTYNSINEWVILTVTLLFVMFC